MRYPLDTSFKMVGGGLNATQQLANLSEKESTSCMHRHTPDRSAGGTGFAVEKAALPYLEIDQHPQPLCLILPCLVPSDNFTKIRVLENAAPKCSRT
jgi:hypothetical protein